MFSFLNKFMLRSLVIKSFFILVLPLSTGFAMREKNEDIYSIEYIDKNGIGNSNIIKNVKKDQGLQEKTEDLSTPVGEKEGEGAKGGGKATDAKNNNIKAAEKGEVSQKYSGGVSTLEIPFHHLGATVGFFEGNDKYSKHVELNCPENIIFFYRRAMFLFFCPLIFNSLLNFIFEIDNKPSGRYFNFFSVGWRTLPFLKIITFDIHFNWFLFAVSAWFDFVYFTDPITREDFFSEENNRNFFIPMFFFAFVFDAVSLCVNFKVDDYFYITVNLSYFLHCIVSYSLCSRVGGDVGLAASSTVCGSCSMCRGRNLKYSGGDQKVGRNLKNLGNRDVENIINDGGDRVENDIKNINNINSSEEDSANNILYDSNNINNISSNLPGNKKGMFNMNSQLVNNTNNNNLFNSFRLMPEEYENDNSNNINANINNKRENNIDYNLLNSSGNVILSRKSNRENNINNNENGEDFIDAE